MAAREACIREDGFIKCSSTYNLQRALTEVNFIPEGWCCVASCTGFTPGEDMY